MNLKDPRKLIVIGFFLLLLGFVLPVLMVVHVIHTSLWLSILSHGASISGLTLGLFGIAMVSKIEESQEPTPQKWWE